MNMEDRVISKIKGSDEILERRKELWKRIYRIYQKEGKRGIEEFLRREKEELKNEIERVINLLLRNI